MGFHRAVGVIPALERLSENKLVTDNLQGQQCCVIELASFDESSVGRL